MSCPGGTPPVYFGGQWRCFNVTPGGLSSTPVSPARRWGVIALVGLGGFGALALISHLHQR